MAARLYEARTGGSRKEKKVFVIGLLRRLAGLGTRFINVAGDTPVSIRGVEASLPSIFNEAVLLSLESTLRTLVHVAAARHARRMNSEMGAFVTGDRGFLSDKKRLSGIIGMPVLSPKEYVDGLGLAAVGR
ncbi:MAG: hypothetical protein JRN39_06680 [Nitrososphaerota archaeon]|nr:hypothetical protein [Nitrososphaerota archaeon]MDG6940067.1 hypothetical protein [Nitrososphaerota archaeon]